MQFTQQRPTFTHAFREYSHIALHFMELSTKSESEEKHLWKNKKQKHQHKRTKGGSHEWPQPKNAIKN